MGGGESGGCQASGYLKYWSYGRYLSLSSDKRGSTSNMSCLLFVVDENVCPLHVTQLCQAHVGPPTPSCSCLHSKQTSHGQMKK